MFPVSPVTSLPIHTQPEPGPTSLSLIRHCEHSDAILEEMYKGLIFDHKIMYIGISSGMAWPPLLSGEGDLNVFLPATLDDNVQGMHSLITRVEALPSDFQALGQSLVDLQRHLQFMQDWGVLLLAPRVQWL